MESLVQAATHDHDLCYISSLLIPVLLNQIGDKVIGQVYLQLVYSLHTRNLPTHNNL